MHELARRKQSVGNVKTAGSAAPPLLPGALLAGALLLLGGCVTTVGYEPPPYYEASSTGAISQPPPPLPQYEQPPCPGDGYLWVPGYWAYSGGYYWVPGTWVLPPQPGVLWTPGYWGFTNGAYAWHDGYWGRHVGFYGGVHYGYGYDGVGYRGGRWEGRHFVYNRYVNNVDVHFVHYTYMERAERTFDGDRVSYEGGRGGIFAHPTREDLRYAHEAHLQATPSQRTHMQQAAANPALFARENGGRPPIAATPRPGHFPGFDGERARAAAGFEPQVGRPNVQIRPNFPPHPHVQERANNPARQSFYAAARGQAHPAAHGPRPDVRPQPRSHAAPGRGPASRPQGRPAPKNHGRPPEHP